MTPPAAILDVDGTIIDTNYQHAIAWYRAFRKLELTLPLWRIHRHIGMGGDQLVSALAGQDVEERLGEEVRAHEKSLYADLIGEVEPMEGARQLILDLKEGGRTVVLASSAKSEEMEHYLDLLDAREIVDGWTTSADVEATKPAPDLIYAALDIVGDGSAVMVGVSIFDCEAATRAGIQTIAVLSGGFSQHELETAGAVLVLESVEELRHRLSDTPLA